MWSHAASELEPLEKNVIFYVWAQEIVKCSQLCSPCSVVWHCDCSYPGDKPRRWLEFPDCLQAVVWRWSPWITAAHMPVISIALFENVKRRCTQIPWLHPKTQNIASFQPVSTATQKRGKERPCPQTHSIYRRWQRPQKRPIDNLAEKISGSSVFVPSSLVADLLFWLCLVSL